jgi:hypothetical protein
MEGRGSSGPILCWVFIVLVLTLTLLFHFISREIVREGVGQWLSHRKSTESLEEFNESHGLNKLNDTRYWLESSPIGPAIG